MYTIILNPQSGRGAALQRLAEVEAVLRKRRYQYHTELAQSPEDATALAHKYSRMDCQGIIALGGDGTLFRIVNGMAHTDVPLLFVPCGTGNDFVRCLNLPKDPIEALNLQLDTPVRRIDVGRMNDIYFLNVSGTGFDVDVLRFADRYKEKYGGLKPYLLGLRDAFKGYHPTRAYISFDDEPEKEADFAIVSVGNGRYFGGGMKAVPLADVQDGLFDVVTVSPVRKFIIPPLLAFYIAGKHVNIKMAKQRRCKIFTLRSKGMTLNLDGELIPADIARYELQQGALAVCIPD